MGSDYLLVDISVIYILVGTKIVSTIDVNSSLLHFMGQRVKSLGRNLNPSMGLLCALTLFT